jgi:hypothetical protein
LYGYRGKQTLELIARCKLSRLTIHYILDYNYPEHACPTRTRRSKILSDAKVNKIIKYFSETYHNKYLNWTELRDKFKLTCIPE